MANPSKSSLLFLLNSATRTTKQKVMGGIFLSYTLSLTGEGKSSGSLEGNKC